jgi:hypothetical protein
MVSPDPASNHINRKLQKYKESTKNFSSLKQYRYLHKFFIYCWVSVPATGTSCELNVFNKIDIHLFNSFGIKRGRIQIQIKQII